MIDADAAKITHHAIQWLGVDVDFLLITQLTVAFVADHGWAVCATRNALYLYS